MAYNPVLRDAIIKAANKYNVDPAVLIATTLAESGGRLDAVGDSGRSHGPFQEYDLGRGAGLSTAQRRDPVGSAMRAAKEFSSYKGLSGGELAYRAQRPADRAGYIAKINGYLDEAQAILGGGALRGSVGGKGTQGVPGATQSAPGPGGSQDGGIQSMIEGFIQSRADRQGGGHGSRFRGLVQQALLAQGSSSAAASTGANSSPERVGAGAASGNTQVGGTGPVGNAVGSPIPGIGPKGSTHQTSGLPGYPAYDYMAKAGTKVGAPVSGTVIRLSGKDPSLGGSPGGPLGYSVYLKGDDGKTYFMTHIDKLSVKAGMRVKQGQQIAVVANGPSSWSSPHVHMGVRG